MNCVNHPEVPVAAYCRVCGKGLCAECRRFALGTVYCDEHLPVPAAGAPGAARPVDPLYPDSPFTSPGYVTPSGLNSSHPGLALILGFIPGVGAIYNGQYAKGLIHAVVFGLLVSIVSSGSTRGWEPLFGILIAVWVFYMAFEAYHTARKRRDGETVDEFSSLIDLQSSRTGFPVGAVLLIGLGFLLLLTTTDYLPIERIIRYWPVLVILLGVYLLYSRMENRAALTEEVRNERR